MTAMGDCLGALNYWYYMETEDRRSVLRPDAAADLIAPHALQAARTALEQLRATAIWELRIHGNDQGMCHSCGSVFPCLRAELAAFALEAL